MERGALAHFALRPDPAVVPVDDLLRDVEAEPHTADVAGEAIRGAVEEPEDAGELGPPDPDAVVGDGELDLLIAPSLHGDVNGPALGRVLHRVADEMVQHLLAAAAT